MLTEQNIELNNTMQDKICLITGATGGVGLEVARGLAARGAHLFIHGRNPSRLEATLRDLQNSTGNQNITPLLADMSSQAQIRQMAQEVHAFTDRLDVLINNAGAVYMNRQLSPDGIELTFATNHLAYFLLTFRLMDILLASPIARIINTSSFAHGYVGTEAVDDYMFEQDYFGWKAYSRSKLCNIYFTYELARRMADLPVSVNALHPGFVNTNIGRNNTPEQLAATPLKKPGHMSSEEGAQTTLYLACSPEVEGITGKYFDQSKAVPSSEASYDQAAALRLWNLSAQLTGEDPDYITTLRKTK